MTPAAVRVMSRPSADVGIWFRAEVRKRPIDDDGDGKDQSDDPPDRGRRIVAAKVAVKMPAETE